MDLDKCSVCKKEGSVVCHDCYQKIFFSYLSERMNGDLICRIKYEVIFELEEKLNIIKKELELIKDILKINKIKKYIKG